MVNRTQIFVLIEDALGNEVWRPVKEVNLGSVKKPVQGIKQVKIIT